MATRLTDVILITRINRSWAIKHRGSFLGYVASREEATRIGEQLVEWLTDDGRTAELRLDEPRAAQAGKPAPAPWLKAGQYDRRQEPGPAPGP